MKIIAIVWVVLRALKHIEHILDINIKTTSDIAANLLSILVVIVLTAIVIYAICI